MILRHTPLRIAVLLWGMVFIGRWAFTDTLVLTNKERVKGIVVEEHRDRILVSTHEGEREFLRSEIQSIEYDEPEYSLLNLARELEERKRWTEALAHYEQALRINPDLIEAKQAALAIKSRMWAVELEEAPRSEIEKRQAIQDARMMRDLEAFIRNERIDRESLLWDRLGIRLELKKEWVKVKDLRWGGSVHKVGLRRGDILAAIDGKSLRFLSTEFVAKELLEPRYAIATLQIHRIASFPRLPNQTKPEDFGFRLGEGYNGLLIEEVVRSEEEPSHPLKKGDLVVEINGSLTRYMPLKEAIELIESTRGAKLLILKINRTLTITRT